MRFLEKVTLLRHFNVIMFGDTFISYHIAKVIHCVQNRCKLMKTLFLIYHIYTQHHEHIIRYCVPYTLHRRGGCLPCSHYWREAMRVKLFHSFNHLLGPYMILTCQMRGGRVVCTGTRLYAWLQDLNTTQVDRPTMDSLKIYRRY